MAETAETMPTIDPTAMPAVKGTLTPYLTLKGAMKAAEFYAAAFGAQIMFAMPPDESGRTMHIHLHVNDASLMLSDHYPEYCSGGDFQTPAGFNLNLHVTDTDAAFARAMEAGATVVLAPENTFWGARYAQVKDPFGVIWAFNQPL